MATTPRLKVTDLDFDSIKKNLRQFLNQQQEFSDYNFEGSALSILIDLLAYNTHYNAYYLNMIANESFLDTALLRDSIVSQAKLLNYVPSSRMAPIATVDIVITPTPAQTNIDTLTIPRGTRFSSELIDEFNYTFLTLKNYTATKSNTSYIFKNVEIYEGTLNKVVFVQNDTANPNSIFTIPNRNIDTRTIKVSVREYSQGATLTGAGLVYQKSTDILDLNSTSRAFFLQEGRDEKYQIFFGDDRLSKKVPDQSQILVTYLTTTGSAANKANTFTPVARVAGYPRNLVTVTTVIPATGGSERESVQSIKLSAPQKYSTQNRLVTAEDYSVYLKSVYPSIESISVWGGEQQDLVVYNKVFISIKLKDNYFLSEAEKQRILNDIIKPKAMITTTAEIVEPDYLFILVSGRINYDPSKTRINETALKNRAISTIRNYNTRELETFNSRYIQSRLQDEVDKSDQAIIGSVLQTRVQKRVPIELRVGRTYTVNFGVSLRRGSLFDRLLSEEFEILDFQGIRRRVRFEEEPYSYTGIEQIQVVNPGSGYTTKPTVTILGDGTGATAEATILNRKIRTIRLTNPGINYTTATVKIQGGGGISAVATPILSGKIGKLRTAYTDANSTTVVVNSNAGKIYYETGIVEINPIRILSIVNPEQLLRFTSYAEDTIIDSKRNLIIKIDNLSADSIMIDVEAI
jgi:hypothetical protein